MNEKISKAESSFVSRVPKIPKADCVWSFLSSLVSGIPKAEELRAKMKEILNAK